ncbi:MAG: AMP-binding protein [Promethearchaeota archaeon]
MSKYSERFWKKSWDTRLDDLDPNLWETSFTDAIKSSFEKVPNKLALAFQGLEITFGELDKYSNQFANMLIDNGFKKGDIVGVNLPNIPEYVIAMIGILKAGCILSGVSPLLSDVQMQYQLSDLGGGEKNVALVTLDAIFAGRLVKIASKLPQLKLVITTSVIGIFPKEQQDKIRAVKDIPFGEVTPLEGKKVIDFREDIIAKYSTDSPDIKVTPDDIAFIQYTGGTTGPPKGAQLTHRNVVSDLIIVQSWLGWEQGKGVALSGFPFFHIAGLFFCENCVYLGWSQVLIPDPRDSQTICNELKKYKPTALVNVPSLFQILLNAKKFKRLDHSNLEVCISAASPFPVESQKALESIVGAGKLLEVYGMTETSPLTTMNPSQGERKLGSIGLPILNTELKLVDPATNEEVPLGEAGEICVKGPQVMKGYYNKPEETKKAIDADGYMHTGDVAIMDENGYLKIVDRTKDMIIVGGFKVFSAKLEDVLTKHPAIGAVATIGIPNPDRPGSEIVKAFIQLDSDYAYDGNEEVLKQNITAFAKENCSPYEVPKIIEISDELPLTTVGKIDKKSLRKL